MEDLVMKRKISVMVVLVFCISVCLSSMSFANSSTISGTLGSHSVLGRLTMSSNGASAHTGTSASGSVFAGVDYCFSWIHEQNYVHRFDEIHGSYSIGVSVSTGYLNIESQGALGRHRASAGAYTWNPQRVNPFPNRVGTWPINLPTYPIN
jgi:hypothetical protein